MRLLRLMLLLLLLLLLLPAYVGAQTSPLQTQVEAILHAAGAERTAGSPGAEKAAAYLAEQLERVTGVPVLRQKFLLVLPQVEVCQATLVRSDGAPGEAVGLYPLLPAAGQAAAVPGGSLTAPVLYAGKGTLAELKGNTVVGHWVALEINSEAAAQAWQTLAGLGAAGVIFLAGPETTAAQLMEKYTAVPVGLPRFYCDDAGAVARFRAGPIPQLKVQVRIRWVEKEVENLLCLIPGRQLSPAAKVPLDWTSQLVVLQARYDASSQVLTRAPGAEQAAWPALALRLAERVARTPDHCTVLIALTGGDEWHFRGTRNVLEMLRPEARTHKRALQELADMQAAVERRARGAQQIVQGLERVVATEGRDLSLYADRPLAQVLRDQLDREAARIDEQLERVRSTPGVVDSTALDQRKAQLVAAAGALQGYRALAGQEAHFVAAARETLPVWQREAARRGRQQAAQATWLPIRRAIAAQSKKMPLMHFDLALTSHGQRCGVFARSGYANAYDFTGRMAEFFAAVRRYHSDAKLDGHAAYFDPDTTGGLYPLNTFLAGRRAFSTDAALLRGQPGAALATVQDAAPWLDTPNDLPERIDFASLERQARAVELLLLGSVGGPGVLTDPRFYGRSDLSSMVTEQRVRLLERTLGETTPRLPAAEVLVGGEHERDRDRQLNGGPLQGVRRFDWYLAHPFVGLNDTEASVTMLSLQRHGFRLHALDFAPDGLPVRSLVANTNEQRGIVHQFTPDPNRPVRAMLFESRRLDVYGLFDPRYLEFLDKLELLDARRVDRAQFSNTFVRDGVAAIFMPPELRWQLLVSKGDLTNRMVLINADPNPAHPEGRGFTSVNLADVGPLAWRTANDLYVLNTRRKAELEKHGITNQVVSELHGQTQELIAAGVRARDEKDYAAWFAHAAAAWSLQEQVYTALISTSNDTIKGVIFLLLGVIPFAYFLERLLVGATNVYKQIGWFCLIFLVMTLALFIHPAFRISKAPLMILLAFLILILSSTVVVILWGKFEEEIARLRGAGAAAHSASLRRGAVFGAAIRLGLSNMRRRGMRTTLTLVTLVLLTFTLLCFTSVRESADLLPRAVEDAPEHAPPGILLRQRAWRSLPLPALALARETAGAGGVISQRWWYASEKPDQRWVIPVTPPAGPTAAFAATGLMGLDANEQHFQSADLRKLLPGFARLQAGEKVCFLPDDAKGHGLTVDTPVNILGESLRVAGFFDADKLDAQLRHLTGDELMPTDPANTVSGPGITASTVPEELAALPEVTYRYLSGRTVALVPMDVVRRAGGRLSSVMIRPADVAHIGQTAEDLARRSAFTVFVSDGQTVRSLNAVESTRPQNFDKVLIPLLIAGVIVLNTMLGAVAERTREIHVYTSVGLAPAHVGMLFLAEAAALGTLGVVFGYIFGQVLATVLSHTQLIAGVDLNYSSMAAIFTMGLVLALVMLSSLWPARSATRVAAPSLQRDWKLPRPAGDILTVDLPFTVNQVAARGVCAFLEEYLLTASQAGAGRFAADHVRAFVNPRMRGIRCRVWLAPFDLGVIQDFYLAIRPTSDPHVFEVRLTLVREAGNPTTWFRLNRPFLVELRKQFLLWRGVRAELVQEYVRRSEVMFDHAEVTNPPS